jgi:hypothetical protein
VKINFGIVEAYLPTLPQIVELGVDPMTLPARDVGNFILAHAEIVEVVPVIGGYQSRSIHPKLS